MIRKTKDRVTHQMDGETGNGGPGTGGGKTTGSPVEAPGWRWTDRVPPCRPAEGDGQGVPFRTAHWGRTGCPHTGRLVETNGQGDTPQERREWAGYPVTLPLLRRSRPALDRRPGPTRVWQRPETCAVPHEAETAAVRAPVGKRVVRVPTLENRIHVHRMSHHTAALRRRPDRSTSEPPPATGDASGACRHGRRARQQPATGGETTGNRSGPGA
jgi:hypothetical protein